MTKKIIIFCLTLLFLSNCGYKPMFSAKNEMFSIGKIKFNKENLLNSKIKKRLKIYRDSKNKKNIYDLNFNTKKQIITISKDTKGDPTKFLMSLTISLEVLENDEILLSKTYNENFNYNNSSNKFDLKQYEKNIEDNLIEKIISNININLQSI